MGGVVVGVLKRKRTVRKMDGSIIDWSDETDGSGDIIRKGVAVNLDKLNEEAKKAKDREIAAQAETHQVVAPPNVDVEVRNAKPGKIEDLEKRVGGLEDGVGEILKILKNKK